MSSVSPASLCVLASPGPRLRVRPLLFTHSRNLAPSLPAGSGPGVPSWNREQWLERGEGLVNGERYWRRRGIKYGIWYDLFCSQNPSTRLRIWNKVAGANFSRNFTPRGGIQNRLWEDKKGVLLFLDKEKFSVRENSIFGIMSWSPRLTRNLVEKIKWICRRAVIIMCPAGLFFLGLNGQNFWFINLPKVLHRIRQCFCVF